MFLTWIEICILYEKGDLGKYITDNNKNAVFLRASLNGHLEVIKYLVEKYGADVRADNDYAVRFASQNGHLEVVKYLVEKCKADVRARNHWAVRRTLLNGHLEVVKYLIKHGAVLSTPNPKYEKYLLVCEKGEEKRRERASKKIYFWWVQVCYDIKRPCGNRMMRRNYEEYHKIVF